MHPIKFDALVGKCKNQYHLGKLKNALVFALIAINLIAHQQYPN